MNAKNGEAELITIVSVLKRYADLGPTQRLQFDELVAGGDLTLGEVPSATLDEFILILSALIPHLDNAAYAEGAIDHVFYLRTGWIPRIEYEDVL